MKIVTGLRPEVLNFAMRERHRFNDTPFPSMSGPTGYQIEFRAVRDSKETRRTRS